jgi:glycosyltransferase involved in cell wall biosynthesis
LLGTDNETGRARYKDKIVRTGWPMEYMDNTLTQYKGMEKKDLILFPHRIAPEKQVDIFRDLKSQLPQYEFIVCQDQELTKNEYHNLLGQAKIVFSASLQETLGIGCYEGAIVDALPMVPDRLSYIEMYLDVFKYPSAWTQSYDAYNQHKHKICDLIVYMMDQYKLHLPKLEKQKQVLHEQFFSATELLRKFQ